MKKRLLFQFLLATFCSVIAAQTPANDALKSKLNPNTDARNQQIPAPASTPATQNTRSSSGAAKTSGPQGTTKPVPATTEPVPAPQSPATHPEKQPAESASAAAKRQLIADGFVVCMTHPDYGKIYCNKDSDKKQPTKYFYIDEDGIATPIDRKAVENVVEENKPAADARVTATPSVPPAPVAPSADVTGTWLLSNGHKAEFFQDGASVYSIYNGLNFKHFLSAQFISANQIQGQAIRIDLNNNCRTVMQINYTLSGNTLRETWTAADGNCDLQSGQTGGGTLTKTEPCARPMNQFGGNAYRPDTDMTGSWGEADWFQEGTNVYYIYNTGSFKHFFQGTRNRNALNGTTIRINRNNNCRTVLHTNIILTDSNHYRLTAGVDDGNCDLPRGWSENVSTSRSWPALNAGLAPGKYRIKNKNSGHVLAVRGATGNNGEEATQWPLDGNTDKTWEFIYVGCGYYKIKNLNSGLFLAVAAASTQNGGKMVQYEDRGQPDIQWRPVDIGNGCFKIQNKNSNLFVAISEGSTAPGADVLQWNDTGQEDIKWVLEAYVP